MYRIIYSIWKVYFFLKKVWVICYYGSLSYIQNYYSFFLLSRWVWGETIWGLCLQLSRRKALSCFTESNALLCRRLAFILCITKREKKMLLIALWTIIRHKAHSVFGDVEMWKKCISELVKCGANIQRQSGTQHGARSSSHKSRLARPFLPRTSASWGGSGREVWAVVIWRQPGLRLDLHWVAVGLQTSSFMPPNSVLGR